MGPRRGNRRSVTVDSTGCDSMTTSVFSCFVTHTRQSSKRSRRRSKLYRHHACMFGQPTRVATRRSSHRYCTVLYSTEEQVKWRALAATCMDTQTIMVRFAQHLRNLEDVARTLKLKDALLPTTIHNPLRKTNIIHFRLGFGWKVTHSPRPVAPLSPQFIVCLTSRNYRHQMYCMIWDAEMHGYV